MQEKSIKYQNKKQKTKNNISAKRKK